MNQTIEELEIVIRAKVDDALKSIDSLSGAIENKLVSTVKQVNKHVNSIDDDKIKSMSKSLEMQTDNTNVKANLDKLKNDVDRKTNEVVKVVSKKAVTLRKLYDAMGNVVVHTDDFTGPSHEKITARDVANAQKRENASWNRNRATTTDYLAMPKDNSGLDASLTDRIMANLKSGLPSFEIQLKNLQSKIDKTKESLQKAFADNDVKNISKYSKELEILSNQYTVMNNKQKKLEASPEYITKQLESRQSELSDARTKLSKKQGELYLLNRYPDKKWTNQNGDKINPENVKNEITIQQQKIQELEAEIEELKSKLGESDENKGSTGKGFFGNAISGIKKFAGLLPKIRIGFGSTFKKGSSALVPFNKAIQRGVKNVAKMTLSLLSVRGAFTIISKASNAYLQMDYKLQKSVQNSWRALGALLAPAIETLVKIFSTATTYVVKFVQALTGINLVARANAKALNSQGEATKQLASIDDISNLSDQDNQITLENVDTSGIEDAVSKVKKLIDSIDFTPLITSVKKFLDEVSSKLDSVIGLGEDLFNNFLYPLSKYVIEKTLPDFFDILADTIDKLDLERVREAFDNLYESLLPFTESLFDGLNWFIEKILEPLTVWTINEAVPTFIDLISSSLDVLNSAIERIKPVVKWLYDNFLEPISTWSSSKFVSSIQSISSAFESLSNFISGKSSSKTYTGRKFASGNVATEPTFAMFGEYAGANSNPEITTPQKTMESSFRKVLSEYGANSNNGNPIVVKVGEKTIYEGFIDYANEKATRNGVSVWKKV